MHKAAAFVYGLDIHHLDHLAPLSSLLNIPLILTNETTLALAQEFYPHVESLFYPPLSFTEPLLLEYDVLFSALPKELIDPIFFFDEHKLKKKLLSIFVPHGNSDKDNLEALKNEKIILAYGKQMLDSLTRKQVLSKLFQYIVVGNFRAYFFEKHASFYDKLLQKRCSFAKKQKTLLFAPTWNSLDVESTLPFLLKHLPPYYNLFVKLHPNTLNKTFHLPLRLQYEEHPNIRFIDDIPTIYPILERSDLLITDLSSVAYDFLSFNRPLFFLTKTKAPIHHTGYISSIATLFNDLEKEDIFQEARSSLDAYAFSKNVNFSLLPSIIQTTYETYFDNELHFL